MKEFTAVVGALVILAAVEVGVWLVSALWLMLAVGDMHRNWWPSVPLMGYHGALGIAWCLSAFLGVIVATGVATQIRKK